jgi:hypothetical protein
MAQKNQVTQSATTEKLNQETTRDKRGIGKDAILKTRDVISVINAKTKMNHQNNPLSAAVGEAYGLT